MILPPRTHAKQRQSDQIADDLTRFLKQKGNRIEVLGPTPLREGKSASQASRAELKLIFQKPVPTRAADRRRATDEEE